VASSVPFKLVTPMGAVFDGEAQLVIAVTTEGEEGILPRHAPLLAALKPGILRANVVSGGTSSRLELATSEGFIAALPDRVTALVDEAVAFDQVVVAETRRQLDEAVERQKAAGNDRERVAREQAVIDFSRAKLRLTGHK